MTPDTQTFAAADAAAEVTTKPKGRAYIAMKEAEYDERLARRRDREDDNYGREDMFQEGEVVVHKETGDLYEVVGAKYQGAGRDWSLRIREVDGEQERHVRPWAVRELDGDDEVEGDEVDAEEVAM